MAERVDVCIVGSGFGGSISAWRLAELYRAAGADAKNILVLERGRRFKHTEFKQSMSVDHLASVYNLIQSTQGSGGQFVVANAVGGGSNLYLAASLRSPREIFERRDHAPDDGPDRRIWPNEISRASLNPYYARVERALRVRQPSWNEVSKSGSLWAASLHAAGHTCDRVPLAIDFGRCVDAKWCHTGCVFGAKNTVTTNYLAAAEVAGVQVRPNRQVNDVRRSTTDGYRYVVTADVMDNEGDHPTRQPAHGMQEEIECRVLILSAGAMGTPPILMRSKQNGDLPSVSERIGKHLGVNGDHIAGVEYDPKKVREVLKLPGYGAFYKGKPITTLSYDWYAGRPGNQNDGKRFTLQEIFLSTLTNFLYDDGRDPAGELSFWGVQKKRSIAAWSDHIEILAMVEDTHDGEFYMAPPNGGGNESPNAGPVKVGLISYTMSEQSLAVRDAANQAIKSVVERRGLGRFLGLTETRGAYCAHPLGGARMAEAKDLGVVNHLCEVFDSDGLFCVDSSAIPSSLGVNPSLTIAAVSERAAEGIVKRSRDLGLPAAPPGFKGGTTPPVHVGDRVVPKLRKPKNATEPPGGC
ncbi:MAG TPA: GMC family oxidoreductase [Thermoleophilaceae bacterium]